MKDSWVYKKYKEEAITELKEKLSLPNIMQVPKLEKIVVSRGVTDPSEMEKSVEELYLITGMKPVVTKAKKSIAGFKLRKGMPIGCKVTLRKAAMYQFFEKLLLSLPYVKNFKGFNAKQFDDNGNFCFGLEEQVVFKEIDYDKVDKVRGMNIVICTSAYNDANAKALLENLGIPFIN